MLEYFATRPPRTRRQIILDIVDDLVTNFLYYDRKESSSLPLGQIEEAIRAGEITINEMVSLFQNRLTAGLVGCASGEDSQ